MGTRDAKQEIPHPEKTDKAVEMDIMKAMRLRSPYDARRHVIRVVGVLPMDQYRSLLGFRTRDTPAQTSSCDAKEVIRQLSRRMSLTSENRDF